MQTAIRVEGKDSFPPQVSRKEQPGHQIITPHVTHMGLLTFRTESY